MTGLRWVKISGSDQVYQCKRCKYGKHDVLWGTGTHLYTPDAMRSAWLDGKIDSPDAHEKIYGYPLTKTMKVNSDHTRN